MKIILVGYPGSQVIVPASKYLTEKYLPGFDITYLNYTGPIHSWGAYLSAKLRAMTDSHIIFALDDYLISGPIDMEKYRGAVSEISDDVGCVKLCQSTKEEHREYPVTTQYCIWNRHYLIWLLEQVQTPWEFELHGSRIFDKRSIHRPCIDYFCNSSLSGRWEGINVAGLKEEDIKDMQEKGLLPGGTTKEDATSTTGIVIFGGSGFLGHALVKRLTDEGHKNITVVARNEGNLVSLKEKFPVVKIMVGDIADPWIVKRAMVGAEECYLLAAMKHVNLAEDQVRSCINTNVNGVMNVISESFVTKPKLLMFISSDKAAQGTGIYGCSKKIGERLMVEAEQMNTETKYRVARYGNILYSSGSVLCKWQEKMKRGEEVIVTDVDATRFYWTVDQAIDLIFDCIANSPDALPGVAPMKSIRLGDLLEAMMEKYGKVPVKTIGLQKGENMHEIITDLLPDSFHSERYTKEEIFQLI